MTCEARVRYRQDASGQLLRGLIHAIHPIESRDRTLVVIRLYGDISGKPKDTVMAAAAYWAAEYRWAPADLEWAKALDDAKVDHFHATDFFNCYGEFRRWKRQSKRHIEFAQRFTRIVQEHQLIGVGYGVNVKGFNEHVRPAMSYVFPKRRRVLSPRMFCIQGCLINVATLLKQFPPHRDERVAVMFEDEPGIGEFIEYFNACKRDRLPWTQRFVSFTTGDKSLRPLQMADLLAHESWRALTNLDEQTERPTRKSFQRMIMGGTVEVKCASESDCADMAAKMHEGYLASKARKERDQ